MTCFVLGSIFLTLVMPWFFCNLVILFIVLHWWWVEWSILQSFITSDEAECFYDFYGLQGKSMIQYHYFFPILT